MKIRCSVCWVNDDTRGADGIVASKHIRSIADLKGKAVTVPGVGDALVHRFAEVDAVGSSTSSTAPFVHGVPPPVPSVQT
jgi:hypothetical protein